MLTVLLVNDISKDMKAMLTKQAKVKLSIHTTCDTIEALEMIQKKSPDVVIADFNTSGPDGFSMIEKAQAQGYCGKFIIVRGSESIEYLKRAIQYGVADYLPKSVSEEKLIDKLRELDGKKAQLQEIILQKFKMFLMPNGYKQDVCLSKADICCLFPHKYIALCVLSDEDDERMNQFHTSLLANFDQIFRFHHGAHTLFLLNFNAGLGADRLFRIWRTAFPGFSWSAGISSVQSVDQIIEDINNNSDSNLYFQALTQILLFLLPIESDKLERIQSNIQYKRDPFSEILIAIQSDYGLNLYFDHLLQNTASLTMAHTIAFLEIASYNLSVFGTKIDSQTVIQTYRYQHQQVADFYSFKRLLRQMLPSFWYMEGTSDRKETNYSEKIQKTILHIKRHFTETLSLDYLARQINLNPCYLSYMFKKEVGMSFSQYLQNLRMEKACALLKSSPNLPVEIISEQAGYLTPTYFFKIFRTYFGMSPNQWRQQKTCLQDYSIS